MTGLNFSPLSQTPPKYEFLKSRVIFYFQFLAGHLEGCQGSTIYYPASQIIVSFLFEMTVSCPNSICIMYTRRAGNLCPNVVACVKHHVGTVTKIFLLIVVSLIISLPA
uniref:Uncharacterized protein n=1 Tax=Setaria viridis TaxID=4556 RepID=A0A4U6UQP8_SETVI|nr:hypothetical protein SEVIR_5G458800v2 [Setaria viridis]